MIQYNLRWLQDYVPAERFGRLVVGWSQFVHVRRCFTFPGSRQTHLPEWYCVLSRCRTPYTVLVELPVYGIMLAACGCIAHLESSRVRIWRAVVVEKGISA